MKVPKFALPIGVEDWIAFLGSHLSENILCTYHWLHPATILGGYHMEDFLVLIGLKFIRPYMPDRVMRWLVRR